MNTSIFTVIATVSREEIKKKLFVFQLNHHDIIVHIFKVSVLGEYDIDVGYNHEVIPTGENKIINEYQDGYITNIITFDVEINNVRNINMDSILLTFIHDSEALELFVIVDGGDQDGDFFEISKQDIVKMNSVLDKLTDLIHTNTIFKWTVSIKYKASSLSREILTFGG